MSWRVARGKERNRPILRSSKTYASWKARAISSLGTFHGCWIGNPPVGGHRLSRPERALLLCGVIADREDEIKLRRVGRGEFIPRLAAQPLDGHSRHFNLAQGLRARSPRGMAARAVSSEPSFSPVVENRLGHDRPRRITGAEKKHIVVFRHRSIPSFPWQQVHSSPAGSKCLSACWRG